jgi:hypothetical protein
MFKRWMIVGGILNALFFLFHAYVGYEIQQLTGLADARRGFMEGCNFAMTLVMFLFAYASLLCPRDLLETKLGHAVLALISAIYLTRAAEELILFKFHGAAFAACLIVGVLYLWALVIATTRERPAASLPLAK